MRARRATPARLTAAGAWCCEWLKQLVAFDPAHLDSYPLAWWIVLPATLLFARLVIALAQALLGSSALLALPVIWVLMIRQFYHWCEQRRLRTLFEQFPDALSMLVRAVRVGIPITGGMRSVATDSPDPTGREFRQVADQLTLGVTLEQALHALAARNQLPEYGFFATALALQAETGGTISDTLERLADVIRKRVALREHARALASEARTSIYILAALPVFAGGALAVINPDYLYTLFVEPQGRTVFAISGRDAHHRDRHDADHRVAEPVMTRQVLFLMALMFAIFVIAGIALNRQLRRDAVLAARVRGVQRSVGIEAVIAPTDPAQSRLLSLVAGVGEAITRAGLLSASTLEELQTASQHGWIPGPERAGRVHRCQVAGPRRTAAAVLDRGLTNRWSPTIRFAAIAGAGVVGLLLPDYVVRTLHKRHLKAVERGLPDALDMLVICSEAGLGLEPAIDRVGREIGHAHQDVAEELLNVAREMRVNADRRAALINMGKRTGLASLQRLGVTLMQTLQYGTPLSQALRTLSAEMRQEALTQFEARAGRLPSLLTVPMIVFILPCVFLIVGGPAIVHVIQLMRQ